MKDPLPELNKNRQTRSMSQRRSESEGPQQRKREKGQTENSATRTERRKTSTTPRKDNNAVKAEAANGSRFGPLQQINEIKLKKPTQISNLKTSNSSTTKSSQSTTTNASSGLSYRNKMGPSTNLSLETRSENKSLLTNKTNLTVNNNNNSNAVVPSPNAKVFNGTNIVTPFKNDSVNNSSGLGKVFNGMDAYSNGKKVQVVQQQNRNVRVITQTSPQANPISSNVSIPSVTNQAQGQNGIGTLITNGSALNLRPAYPSLRVEDQPKKKIVYVPPPQSNKYKVDILLLVRVLKNDVVLCWWR